MKKTYLKPQITAIHVFEKPFMSEIASVQSGAIGSDGSIENYDSGIDNTQEGDGTEGDARGFSLWDIEEEGDGGF